MSDLIDRRAALDIINHELNGWLTDDERLHLEGIGIAIESLPSAPCWIPVTERLPEIDMSHQHHEDYLVQYDSGNMDVASLSNVVFWSDRITKPHWDCKVPFAEVVAWMPLPKPWEGEISNEKG